MKQWLRNKLKSFLSDDESKEINLSNSPVYEANFEGSRNSTLRFNVTQASGGVIVQYNTYNEKRDENDIHTYVIHDDEQVTHRVAEIVTMALLRR